MDETTDCVRIHDTQEKCAFYENTVSCHNSEGKLDYMYFIFCYLQQQHSWAGITLCFFVRDRDFIKLPLRCHEETYLLTILEWQCSEFQYPLSSGAPFNNYGIVFLSSK
ncbi:hypothetical protein TNCV_587111 [Trichonephila clavipes]|nr:hypothetical protein TNCV_587111 [Trichonephila clavipes]